LDDRTQPQTTTIPTLSEKHFNMLFDILVDEKRSRLRLEECVVKLENELLATQKGVQNLFVPGLIQVQCLPWKRLSIFSHK
jgi:hypothetical protein